MPQFGSLAVSLSPRCGLHNKVTFPNNWGSRVLAAPILQCDLRIVSAVCREGDAGLGRHRHGTVLQYHRHHQSAIERPLPNV